MVHIVVNMGEKYSCRNEEIFKLNYLKWLPAPKDLIISSKRSSKQLPDQSVQRHGLNDFSLCGKIFFHQIGRKTGMYRDDLNQLAWLEIMKVARCDF